MEIEGYEINLFLKTVISSELFCSMCKNVMKDPVTCLTCNIWLCLKCTKNACNFGNKKHSYSPINKFIKNKIDELQIKCKNNNQGFLKVLKVSCIEKHEERCEFSKMIDKKKVITSADSIYHSNNCPTAIFKCPTCKKQILMTEKSNHDCIQYLLESIVKLGKENEDLTYFNKERLVEKEKNEKNHQTFLYESQVQKQILEEDNENKQRENYLLREEIDKIKRNREKKISLIMKEFYEFADKKNEKLQEKNEKERKNLFRRINNCTNDYLDKAKKGLFDLNCFVQADAGDLSKVPTDMKEYDKSPLRKFTTVGPAKINI